MQNLSKYFFKKIEMKSNPNRRGVRIKEIPLIMLDFSNLSK